MKKIEQNEWDLEDILEGKTLEYLHQQWFEINTKIVELYPDFLKSLKNFKQWIKINEDEEKISNRLSNYISNKANINVIDSMWTDWENKLEFESEEFSKKTFDYDNIIIKNEDTVKRYLKDKELIEYSRGFEKIFKQKNHILSEVEELLLTNISGISGQSEIFEILNSSEIKFKPALDSAGKEHEIINSSAVHSLLQNEDRTLRKNVWMSYQDAYYGFLTSFHTCLHYQYKMFNKYSKVRKYEDYISSCCISDEIDKKFILNLYSNVEEYKDVFVKYRELRNKKIKKLFNIDKIEPWDLSLELTKKQMKFSIDEAKQIVLEALKPLGEEYLEIVKKAFNENWISFNIKKNKRGGAYSIGGTNGLKKYYILMNFDGTLDSIYTLIHELGHSLNSYYYNKVQKVYKSVKIFTAEIASITNEKLLSYYLLNKYKNDKEFKEMIINKMLSDFFSTVTTQIIFSNWEYEVNELINTNQPFNKEIGMELYKKMMIKYKGDFKYDISKEPYNKSLASIYRIPHFYSGNFYVYKYAIGEMVAQYASKKISTDKKFISQYFNFLSSGNSKSPLETIKILGFEFNKKSNDFIKKGIEEILKEF